MPEQQGGFVTLMTHGGSIPSRSVWQVLGCILAHMHNVSSRVCAGACVRMVARGCCDRGMCGCTVHATCMQTKHNSSSTRCWARPVNRGLAISKGCTQCHAWRSHVVGLWDIGQSATCRGQPRRGLCRATCIAQLAGACTLLHVGPGVRTAQGDVLCAASHQQCCQRQKQTSPALSAFRHFCGGSLCDCQVSAHACMCAEEAAAGLDAPSGP